MNKLFFTVLISFLWHCSYGQYVTDIDGNRYPAIRIKNQVWMGENLKTTRFNDGKPIPLVVTDKAWKTLEKPAYCWLYNDTANKEKYGALYNWYAVNTKKLCPQGWHVPSLQDWEDLSLAAGGERIAGAKLKEKGYEHWKNNMLISTDEYGFTALPSGKRSMEGNFPSDIDEYAVWWSATEVSAILSYNTGVYFGSNALFNGNDNKKNGFSVRCVKDK
ncbi:MAG: fibrobacter succinogenes major paralogous domain-containing protein [Bacteroidales bacterium]